MNYQLSTPHAYLPRTLYLESSYCGIIHLERRIALTCGKLV